jgi:hypothetical protein
MALESNRLVKYESSYRSNLDLEESWHSEPPSLERLHVERVPKHVNNRNGYLIRPAHDRSLMTIRGLCYLMRLQAYCVDTCPILATV